jgi:hypothetical protein
VKKMVHVFTVQEIDLALELLAEATFNVELDDRDKAVVARAKAIKGGDTITIRKNRRW